MADKEGFSFEEEEKSGTESGISWMEQETHPEVTPGPEKGSKGSMTRILLLVLLLVAVGGAGFYFLTGTPEVMEPPPTPPLAAVKKQPIAVPVRPVEENSPVEKEPMAAVVETAPQDPAPETPNAVEKKDLPEKSPVAQEVPGEKAGLSASVEAPDRSAAAAGDYAVAAGAFLLRSNLAEAEKKVRGSGFEPQVVQKKRKLDMTRLRVGTFSLQEGKKKMEELTELAPDAFYLPVDGGIAVYAASFQNVDKARNFADRLYSQGLRVEEESARVEIPLYLLSVGGFADLESAREAAGQVRAAGLDAMVIKNP
jgi:cell division septation protein DedD